MSGRQSFNRGITIMKLLAKNGSMTASALARELGLNQSSVSRLLQSLIRAGFVYKPSFQKFKLDYGILTFAGIALENFPLASASVTCCNTLHKKTNMGTAIALLHDERLLYMARVHAHIDSSLNLIDNSDFPIHLSSLGLALSYQRGRESFKKIITRSIKNWGTDTAQEPELYSLVKNSFEQYGFLYLLNYGYNKMNAAGLFQYEDTIASIALYSTSAKISPDECRKYLLEGIELLGKEAVPHATFATISGK
jgi:DNA-binding IclR family transcriptional regulator